jgi:galactose-1-phosphate uridylyltransferase
MPQQRAENRTQAMGYEDLIHQMPDGTLKMTNPLTGGTAWWVPGRIGRPDLHDTPACLEHDELHEPEDYCSFCPRNFLDTPPEIERRVRDGAGYRSASHMLPGNLPDGGFAFRRMANLYEIVTLDYWRRNYDYRGRADRIEWAEAYKNDSEGRDHLLALVRTKLTALREAGEDLPDMNEEQMLAEADSFFLGCHQLIVAERHYQQGATEGTAHTLQWSGALDPDFHFEYFRFTADSIRDIFLSNRYVRFVVTFQNWLSPSGASFDHLHKQLVGLDDWGTLLAREVEACRTDPNLYNSLVVNYAGYSNLVIAENDHAVLFADFGHRYPTLAVYSKARSLRPFEHSEEELRAVSDLVHACHAAQGPETSCNEEWYYQPRDCLERLPFHVLIKWRVNNPAGFEGGTSIFINPLRPNDVRDEVVPELFRLRDNGEIAPGIRIAEECPVEPNSLLYNR